MGPVNGRYRPVSVLGLAGGPQTFTGRRHLVLLVVEATALPAALLVVLFPELGLLEILLTLLALLAVLATLLTLLAALALL